MTSRLFILCCCLLLLQACGGQSRWDDQRQTHIVRKGETLYSIAWRYGKDPDDVARWNRLGDGSLIYPGQVLRLQPGKSSGAQSSSSRRTRTHHDELNWHTTPLSVRNTA